MAVNSAVPTPTTIPAGPVRLKADLAVPPHAKGLVIFAHGSGSSRLSPRNQHVAEILRAHGLGTLLADLLTTGEEIEDRRTAGLRFDIDLLGTRVAHLVDWARLGPETATLPIGLFGASTGAAAALVAAAARPEVVRAVVSRGGRPDLADDALPRVQAPTLLLVGSLDPVVLDLNREAQSRMTTVATLEVVPGATHLFEEPGTLEHVADRAALWLDRYLSRPPERHQRSPP
ncbi:MAG: dienelactone hydrolase family protein [Vicinamibacterales bacterium]